MIRLSIIASVALMAACSPPPPPPRPAEPPAPPPAVEESRISTPVDVVRPYYDAMLTPDVPDPPRDGHFSAELKQIWDAFARHDREGIDFDPFINAQDFDITAVDLALEDPSTGRAVVRASFINFGEPRNVRFDMIFEEGAWRIDNMRGDNPPYDLRQVLTAEP